MNELKFSDLNLIPEMQHAIDVLGFEQPTDIQAQAIPLLRGGADVIGRSQTGTGKTFAFAIPAIERIDRNEKTPTPQVLILCPTRELAQQGCAEIKKLTRFMLNVWPADVYGGAPMDRQITRLRHCNLVIGTPGRIMDHMRRGSLTLSNIRMVILDEADEMLSMGFREDIETILKDIPEEHQTVLFSATMPDSIMELTELYQKNPVVISVNQAQVTLDQIHQMSVEVPMGRKLDALLLLLHAFNPSRTILFCNTKLMVDELSTHLNKNGFTCEAIHGDMNQSQRTRVMEGFKSARLPILVATDVAARGIDVNDVDYVINYDVPQNSEYYVHRIGRTGRAGKEGRALTICSGRRQVYQLRDIAKDTKSVIESIPIPTVADIRLRIDRKNLALVQETILNGVSERHLKMVSELIERGHDLTTLAAAAMDLCFLKDESALQDIVVERRARDNGTYRKLSINVGRRQKISPNHVVSAIAERANIPGKQIGKIEIYDERTIVGIPSDQAEAILRDLTGLKICGIPVNVYLIPEKKENTSANQHGRLPKSENPEPSSGRPVKTAYRKGKEDRKALPVRRGKVILSAEAKARLLDGDNLSRYEIKPSKKSNPATYEKKSRKKDSYDYRAPRAREKCKFNRGKDTKKHHS